MTMVALNSATNLPAQPASKVEKAAVSPSVKAPPSAPPETSDTETKVEASKAADHAPVTSNAAASMRFSLGGDDGKQVIIEIYDAEKGVLVRTIPYEAMSEKGKGMVLNVKA